MIKKLQALKAKKGFTLVELVVVIAIIGVLAAILVPTMIGVVQDANITSADSAASQAKTQATRFFANMETAKKGYTGASEIAFFTVSGTDANGNPRWAGTGTGSFKNGATWQNGTKTETDFCLFMGDALREMKQAKVSIYIKNQAISGVAVVMDQNYDDAGFPVDTDWTAGTFSFGANAPKAGLDANGNIMGTAPKLTLPTAGT